MRRTENKIATGVLFNHSVIFSGKPIGFEEFLKRMIEVLGLLYRPSKGRLRKRES